MSKHSLQHLDRVLDNGVHPTMRRVYLFGDVDRALARQLRVTLDVLTDVSREPITLVMSSDGGSVYDGMAMYDSIKTCPAVTEGLFTGSCMSMAVAILQACTVRRATKLTTFMVHDGTDSATGHARNVEAWGAESKRLRRLYYEMLASRSKRDVRWWERNCVVDRIFTADEALSLGLIDEVVE